jgi:hypothetical protein
VLGAGLPWAGLDGAEMVAGLDWAWHWAGWAMGAALGWALSRVGRWVGLGWAMGWPRSWGGRWAGLGLAGLGAVLGSGRLAALG